MMTQRERGVKQAGRAAERLVILLTPDREPATQLLFWINLLRVVDDHRRVMLRQAEITVLV